MSEEVCFQQITRQIANLVGCDSVHLFLGCPEPELRHPLLELFSATNYCHVGYAGLAGDGVLLQLERVRVLCDGAIQTGQLQGINQFQMFADGTYVQSIAIAPLERPAGVLGLLLLTDHRAGAFYYGERLLLNHYLPQVAQKLEEDLRRICALPTNSSHVVVRSSELERTEIQPLEEVFRETTSRPGQHVVEYAQVQQQLKELDRLKNEFISMVSHELRTPLTAIKGYAILLRAYGLSAPGDQNEGSPGEMSLTRQREYLNIIMEQATHLEVLISDLLDISRIHAGRLPLRCRQLDVAMLCQRVVQLIQQRVDQQEPGRYKISCNLPSDLPLTWSDSDRVQQVLTNLLENAVKYSPGGGLIEVIASTCPATLQSCSDFSLTELDVAQEVEEPGMIQITVRDRGIGIARDQQSYLFQPFRRLEHPFTDNVPGAGLGLYITRKLVEAMGGEVALCSSEGAGTSVTFTLPVMSPRNLPAADYTPMTALITS